MTVTRGARRVMREATDYGLRAARKPIHLVLFAGVVFERNDARQLVTGSSQPPLRSKRKEPDAGPVGLVTFADENRPYQS